MNAPCPHGIETETCQACERAAAVTRAIVAHALTEAIAERNLQAWQNWQIRMGLGLECPDAWPPVWRVRLNDWFDEQRALARRWMFKDRCAKRELLNHLNWSRFSNQVRYS